MLLKCTVKLISINTMKISKIADDNYVNVIKLLPA